MRKILNAMIFVLTFTATEAMAAINCSPLPPGATQGYREQLSSGGYGFCIVTACGTNAGVQLEVNNNSCVLPPSVSWFTLNQVVTAASTTITVRAKLSRAPSAPVTVSLSASESTASTVGSPPDFELLTPTATFTSTTSTPIQIKLFKPLIYKAPVQIRLKASGVISGNALLSGAILVVDLNSPLQGPQLPILSLSAASVVEGQPATLTINSSRVLSTTFPTKINILISGPAGNISPLKMAVNMPSNKTTVNIVIPTTNIPGYQGARVMTATMTLSSLSVAPESTMVNTISIADSSLRPPSSGLELGVTIQRANGYVIKSSKAISNYQQSNGYLYSGEIVRFGK